MKNDMDLFTETLADYLKTEWQRVMSNSDGIKEARFIIESLEPFSTFDLFAELEEFRLKALQSQRLECHFKVAKNLWDDWCKYEERQTLLKTMISKGAVDANANYKLKWIDEEDRLTWYRNRTLSPDKDGLVIVLLGFNHASDQGGLANFHLVDENRIWKELEQSYYPWIKRINERLGLDATDSEMDRFDDLLQQLFKVRPRSLVMLANFFERELFPYKQDLHSMSEVIAHVYKALPFWGIPPLFKVNNKQKNLLKDAENFISYQRFKSASEQNKVWEKLEKYWQKQLDDEEDFVIPETLNSQALFADFNAYKQTLQNFIFRADTEAKNLLLQTDLSPILEILKRRESNGSSGKDKVQRLKGFGLEVILQAVWQSWLGFAEHCGSRSLGDVIPQIHINFTRFNHDLENDDDAGQNAQTLAEELFLGCLGGLDELCADIVLRLPVDSDQAACHADSWSVEVPLALDLSTVSYGKSKANPHFILQVTITAEEDIKPFKPLIFRWDFPSTHPERVRFLTARKMLERWQDNHALLAYKIPKLVMTALYFAADEEEANRLMIQALDEIELVDLIQDLPSSYVDSQLLVSVHALTNAYQTWLQRYVSEGYYQARNAVIELQQAYIELSKQVLDKNMLGSAELLRRFYKAFLLVDEDMRPNDAYLRSAIVFGISPPVLELTYAREKFLCDSFSEIIVAHERWDNGKQTLNRLLNLVEIHRPLAALVIDAGHNLSAKIKSFGLLHYLGEPPSTEKSLAVQTLLREEESDDDEDVSDVVRETEESEVVVSVLNNYLALYPFAEDGLRILAVHVQDLAIILSGVNKFLKNYLQKSFPEWPDFHCELMVYSTSAAPLAIESRLMAWRDHVLEAYREKGRPLKLSVSHHFAPRQEKMIELLKKESRLYDVSFLFHFLAEQLQGNAKSAEPFEFDFNSHNINQFPICEYPRPIEQGFPLQRQTLLSNRRLQLQTRHADLSARLRFPESSNCEHLIFGQIDYQPWQDLIAALHKTSQWLACIDPFVDKRLLTNSDNNGNRKIVGFTSGLGAYGELNLSISTEQDTLTQLTDKIKNHLLGLLPFQYESDFEEMAAKIVSESEEIIGLSSLRAVVGNGEKIREVIGFSAIRRALAKPSSDISQLLPVDSLLHWFADSHVKHRPDLLQLSLIQREGDIPLIEAVLIECKFAQHNANHLRKAIDQIQDGLSHLTELFIPNRSDINRVSFDRRYWWAQLQRAITSRSVVSMSEQQSKKLDVVLEQIAEGYYEISWQAAIFTFWTDDSSSQIENTAIALVSDVIKSPLQMPPEFAISHIAMGCENLVSLFKHEHQAYQLSLSTDLIRIRPQTGFGSNSVISGSSVETTNEEDDFSFQTNPNVVSVEVNPESVALSSENTEFETEKDHAIENNPSVVTIKSEVVTSISVPDTILIGHKTNGEPVYWHYGHPKLANRHLLLFGTSGSGKTYAIQCLLAEMAQQNLRSLIIDYTDGFLPQQIESCFSDVSKPQNHFLIKDKLPLNPFRKQQQIIDPSFPAIEENPYQVATRIASIFTSVFNSTGDQQSAALIRVLEAGIAENENFSFSEMLPRLREDSQYGESLANKLEPFIKAEPFRQSLESAWEQIFGNSENWVHILQLKGLARDIQKIVTEFALWDLYDYACNSGSKNRPLPVVLDEIQNLDHRSDSPIDKMLREGRKFGLSLLLATQTTSQFDQEQRDRLFQAGHKLFFKPASTEISRFAELLSVATGISKSEWAERLSNLQKGQCWSLGSVLTSSGALKDVPILVSITPFEKRNFGM